MSGGRASGADGRLSARTGVAVSFADALKGISRGDNPRTGQPVWRNSYYEGTFEHQIWRPIAGGSVRGASRWRGAVLKCARDIERKTRLARQEAMPGVRNGVLGQVGIDVLEALWQLVDFATGRLDPAIATLAEMTGHCYNAVHEALCRLRSAGFLQWIRRSRPLDRKGEAGPQVEQITNAYVLVLPREVEETVKALVDWGRIPACEEDRRRAARKSVDEMLAGLSAVDFLEATWTGDRLLGASLKSLAASFDDRDGRASGRGANRRRREKPGASDL